MDLNLLKMHQPFAFQMLVNGFIKDRLSHAYLFVGSKGTSKLDMAIFFAQMLYCQSDEKPCQTCNHCKRIETHNHINVHLIEPDGQNIKKEQIQQLQEEFSKTSLEQGPRVYIINHIDRMSPSAANSLLKFLEEPTGHTTYAVLLTENVGQVLPTIVSRCQMIPFKLGDRNVLRNTLLESGIHPSIASVASILTNNIVQATAFAEDDSLLTLIEMTEEMGRTLLDPKALLILFFKEKVQTLEASKEAYSHLLTLMMLYFMDVLYAKIGYEVKVFDSELPTIMRLKDHYEMDEIKHKLMAVMETNQKMHYNVMPSLTFDQLLVRLDRGE